MANTVYDSKPVRLQDGTDVVLVPLAIGRLRRFLDAWDKTQSMEDDDDFFDVYINCCGIALEKELVAAQKIEKTRDQDNVLTEEYREYLEDVLDIDTIWEILEVCGGLKRPDPKLLEEAQRRLLAQVGTDSTSQN